MSSQLEIQITPEQARRLREATNRLKKTTRETKRASVKFTAACAKMSEFTSGMYRAAGSCLKQGNIEPSN